MTINLDLLTYVTALRLREEAGQRHVFDPLRKKWLAFLPEEMVRQLFVQYLLQQRGLGRGRVAIERQLQFNGMSRRCDVLVFGADGRPMMLVECKAPTVPLSQAVFDQVSQYNLPLQVPYLAIVNGMEMFCCKIDYLGREYQFLETFPDM